MFIYTFDGSGRFYYVQRQTFPAVRIARGIKMTAHWILRTGPTAALHRRRTGGAPAWYKQPVAPVIFIAVIMRLSAFPRPVDQSDETYSRRTTEPRPRPFIVNTPNIFFAQNKLTLLNQADFPVRGTYFKWLLRWIASRYKYWNIYHDLYVMSNISWYRMNILEIYPYESRLNIQIYLNIKLININYAWNIIA